MAFYGRHKVYVLFWTWKTSPFMVTTDLISGVVSKSVESGTRASLSLFPRKVPKVTLDDRIIRSYNAGYMDVLAPNDWIFIFVDPQDNDVPEPLFMGLLDRVSTRRAVDNKGGIQETIEVSATGWEKVCKQTQALSNPYISDKINFVNLYALGSAGQQPQLDDDSDSPPSRTAGIGMFHDKLPRVISYFMRLFLRTNSNPFDDVSVAANISKLISSIGITNYDESAGNDASTGNPALFGQFELPQVGIPLWYFIRLAFEDLNQKVYVNPAMFLNQVNQSLARLIDSARNPLLNDLIYDVRRISNDGLSDLIGKLERSINGGYTIEAINTLVTAASTVNPTFGALVNDVAPYMILRERPLFANELLDLDGPTIDEDEIIEKDVGLSDCDLHNLTIIDTPGINNNAVGIRAMSGFAGYDAYKDETTESIRRHGIRLYQDSTMAWPGTTDVPLPDPALTRDWDLRLHRAGLDNIKTWNGSLTIPKYYRDLFLGGKVVVVPNRKSSAEYAEKTRVYYVDGLDYNFDNQNGMFSTRIAVTRGQESNQFMG